jgi:hypothetical protein
MKHLNAYWTVSVNVVVCDVEPAVAVIVTVEVPDGVPVLPPPLVEPELPPHPANPRIATLTKQQEASSPNRNAGFASSASNRTNSIDRATNKRRTVATGKGAKYHRCSRVGEITALPADVAIVIVVVEALAPLGVTVAGLKLHEAPVGRPEQVKLTCWLNPPLGVTPTVLVAELPAATFALIGAAASVKLPDDPPPTLTATAVDVDDAKVPSPP